MKNSNEIYMPSNIGPNKYGLLLLFVALFTINFKAFANEAQETALAVVGEVDLNKYQGQWFEIASIPVKFQAQCFGGTTAEYQLLNDGLIKVVNTCTTSKGESDAVEGRAKVVTPPAKLKVTFVKILTWIWAFGGAYWIIDLAPDYSYAVVGHPSRDYLWILSRTPNMTTDLLKSISQKLTNLGYDTCRVLVTPQNGQLAPVEQREKLCQLN